MPPPDFMRQVTEMRNAFDFRSINTPDTTSMHIPQVSFVDSGRQVDSIPTKNGRNFQIQNDGSVTYKLTSKDQIGLNHVVKDYMTARDGRTPTPDQIRKMVDQIGKDPANGIKDVNNIRAGQTLRFPGPEQAPRVPDMRMPMHPPMDWRHPMPPDRPLVPPPGYERGQWLQRPPEKAPQNPLVSPPGTEERPDGKNPDTVQWRKQTDSIDNRDGTRTTTYRGSLDDGSSFMFGTGRTRFSATDRKDSDGRLVERRVQYENDSVKMQVTDDKGQTQDVWARNVIVKYNQRTGDYDTTVTDSSGRSYQMRTGPDGKPIR